MQESGAVEFAQDDGELVEEEALEVDVFLAGADDVGGGGEGVAVAVAWGGGRGGIDVVGGIVGCDHIAMAMSFLLSLNAQRARALYCEDADRWISLELLMRASLGLG